MAMKKGGCVSTVVMAEEEKRGQKSEYNSIPFRRGIYTHTRSTRSVSLPTRYVTVRDCTCTVLVVHYSLTFIHYLIITTYYYRARTRNSPSYAVRTRQNGAQQCQEQGPKTRISNLQSRGLRGNKDSKVEIHIEYLEITNKRSTGCRSLGVSTLRKLGTLQVSVTL